MGNAAVAVELLLADNKETAANIAAELCETNRLRQTEENKIVDSALEKIEEEWDVHLKNNGVIVLDGEDWQHGVIGIVASRVTERYGLPSILISFEGSVPAFSEESPVDLGKGSGRSIKGFNLVAALSECSDLLEKYGGHELAAGLSVRRGNLEAFRTKINEYAMPILDNLERVQIIEADREVCAEDLTLGFAKELSQIIEPCGPMNPTPSFIMKDVTVNSVRGIGAGKHIKLTFESGKRKFTGLWFGVSEAETSFKQGDLVDILFTVGINTFNGNTELQLILTDMRYAESVYQCRIEKREKLRAILEGEKFSSKDNLLPNRNDFVALYKLFINHVKNGRYSVTDSSAEKMLAASLPADAVPNFVKYRLMLEIFNELDIFKVEYLPLVSDENGDRWQLPEDICVITRGSAEKVNLDDSSILACLRSRMTE
jgi:single-stranded-DNA-specific exonuclease